MEASSSSSSPPPATAATATAPAPVPSDEAVSDIMQQGLRDVVLWTAGGTVAGGLAGIVLARGGGGTAARKVLAGLGGGCGLGAAWTRTSVTLEHLLAAAAADETTK